MVTLLKKTWIKLCFILSIYFGNQAINALKDDINLIDQKTLDNLDELNKISVTF